MRKKHVLKIYLLFNLHSHNLQNGLEQITRTIMKHVVLIIRNFLLFLAFASHAMQFKGIGIWTLTKTGQLHVLNTLIEKNEPFVDAVLHHHQHIFYSPDATIFLQTILKICRTNNFTKLHDKFVSKMMPNTFIPMYYFNNNPQKIVSVEDPSLYLATSWIWNDSRYLEKDIELMMNNETWPLIFSESLAPIETLSWIPDYNEFALALKNKLTFLFNCAQILESLSCFPLNIKTILENNNLFDLLQQTCTKETIHHCIHISDIALVLDEYKKNHHGCTHCCPEYRLPSLDEHINHVLQHMPLVWSGTPQRLMFKALCFLALIQQFEKNSKPVQDIARKYQASIHKNLDRLFAFRQKCINHITTTKNFKTHEQVTSKEAPSYFS